MYHFVYKTTNITNGKYYYGVHSTSDINDGYLGSGHALRRAIEKYGPSNFVREIIALVDDRDEALQIEKEIVNGQIVEDERCYNIALGGGCPPIQRAENLDTNRLKGKARTEAQQRASSFHSQRMKGRLAPNSKPIQLFGQSFPSISAALKFFGLSRSHYNFLEKASAKGQTFNSSTELKEASWAHRNQLISIKRQNRGVVCG